jgi:ABC-type spermidine/putrescine transport system permease subunit I
MSVLLYFFLSPTTIVVFVVVVVVSPKVCRGFLNMCEDWRESFSGGTERPSLYRLLFVSLSLSLLSTLVCFL